jgi:hypothetical protein
MNMPRYLQLQEPFLQSWNIWEGKSFLHSEKILQFANIFYVYICCSKSYIPLLDTEIVTCLQINLYLEQPMEVQLFATFLQRRK